MKKKRELETELFYIGLVGLAAGTCAVIFYFCVLRDMLPILPCFFSSVMGIYCPGCGGTRSLTALLHGHFLLSLWYHPLVPYMAIIGGGFMVTQGLCRLGVKGVKGWKFHNWYLYGAVFLVILNFLVKNLLRLRWGILM